MPQVYIYFQVKINLSTNCSQQDRCWRDIRIAPTMIHDDVIKWRFPCYWTFVRGIHRPRWIPRKKAKRPVTRSLDVFFDLRLYKRLSKQPWGWWIETPSWSLWRQCNDMSLWGSAHMAWDITSGYRKETRRAISLTRTMWTPCKWRHLM